MSNRGKAMRIENDIRNQQDIVDKTANKTGFTKKDINKIFNAIWDSILEEIEEDHSVNLHGKGKFYLSKRKERIGRNPQTGEEINIPPRELMAFKNSPSYVQKLRKIRAEKHKEK